MKGTGMYPHVHVNALFWTDDQLFCHSIELNPEWSTEAMDSG